MLQIAEKLEQEGNTAGSEEIKKLAVTGHNLALIEKELETYINECKDDYICNLDKRASLMTKPAGYDETYDTYKDNHYGAATDSYINLGKARYDINNGSSYLYGIGVDMVNYYDSVMSSSAVDDQSKKIVTELYRDIGIIGETLSNSIEFAKSSEDSLSANYFDPITGEVSFEKKISGFSADDINKNVASKLTHVDSALICVTGNYQDVDNQCQ